MLNMVMSEWSNIYLAAAERQSTDGESVPRNGSNCPSLGVGGVGGLGGLKGEGSEGDFPDLTQ